MRLRDLALALGLACAAGDVSAQRELSVPDEPACPGCTVELAPMFTVGGLESAIASDLYSVLELEDGWVATQFRGDGKLLRFSREGAELEPWGREGQGPGEYLLPRHVHRRGDTIVVFDGSNARVTYLDQTGAVLKVRPFRGRVSDGVSLPDGRFMLNALVSQSGLYGIPLHTFTREREHERGFGGPGHISHDAPLAWSRELAPASDGNVWVAYNSQYVIEKWSPDGEMLLRISRETDWFSPYLRRSWGGPERPIDPRLMDLVEGDDGLLYVLINVASEDWDELVPPAEPTPLGMLPRIRGGMGLTESMIEVIDPSSSRLILSTRVPQELSGFIDHHILKEHSVRPDEVPRITFWHMRIRSTPDAPAGALEEIR